MCIGRRCLLRGSRPWPAESLPSSRHSPHTNTLHPPPAMTLQFPDHQPGQPYNLTREQFAQFAGIQLTLVKAGAGEVSQFSRVEFWTQIAIFEAHRTFSPLLECCYSKLSMDTQSAVSARHIGCVMRWEYTSTSGTKFVAQEAREYQLESEYQCSEELPAPSFQVVIPAERDQPGRSHYEQLRSGGSYKEWSDCFAPLHPIKTDHRGKGTPDAKHAAPAGQGCCSAENSCLPAQRQRTGRTQ